MTSRHGDSLHGSFARLPATNSNYTPQSNSTHRREPLPSRLYAPPPLTTNATSTPPSTYPTPAQPVASSLLEKHAIASYTSQPTRPPASLSIYERPTATFMWPRFDTKPAEPASPTPVIFVKYSRLEYRSPQDDSDQADSSPSLSARESLWSEPSNLTARSTPASTPPRELSRKGSSSPEFDDNLARPSDRFLKRPRSSRHSPYDRMSSGRIPSEARAQGPADRPPRLAEMDLQRSFQTLGIASNGGDVRMRDNVSVPAPVPAPAPVHHSISSCAAFSPRAAPAPAANVGANPRAAVVAKPNARKNEWLQYVKKRPQWEVHDGREWMCTWREVMEDGREVPCKYKAKKHLVKRHLESKHMQLRTWQCTYCKKGFSQKSNLDTHLNTHTGRMPHKCYYCDEHFKDPARRQRHMQKIHSHLSCFQKKEMSSKEATTENADQEAGASSSDAASDVDVEMGNDVGDETPRPSSM